jgi:hypothetical protein
MKHQNLYKNFLHNIYNILLVFGFVCIFIGCSTFAVPDKLTDGGEAPIFPQYSETCFPYNIAAPNFIIEDEGKKHFVKIFSASSDTIFIKGRHTIRIPLSKWHKLLKKNAGQPLFFEIFSRTKNGWIKYKTIQNQIAQEPIDPYLVYRLVNSGDTQHSHLRIYQRRLEDYSKKVIFSTEYTDGTSCINCHTFNQNNPEYMLIARRSFENYGIIKWQGDSLVKIDHTKSGDLALKLVYPAWHPSGRFIAFSTNNFKTYFHWEHQRRAAHLIDTLSDIVLYDVEKNTVLHFPQLTTPNMEETMPCWSADGKTLYYCRAKTLKRADGESALDYIFRIKYDLVKVSFDEKSLTFGEPEVIVAASEYNRSVFQPRTSNNGRFLIYTELLGNTFPPAQRISNLRLLDLETNRIDSLNNINSDELDSWHSWSSESKWFVFSSKRKDGDFAHLYFGYIDSNGNAPYKPFILPQKSLKFYKNFLFSYNLPELIKSPILVRIKNLTAIADEKAKPALHRFVGESPDYKTILESETPANNPTSK